jgi:hypothetical protein
MFSRRAVINGTALGAWLSATAPAYGEAAGEPLADIPDRLMEDVVKAVRSVRDELERQATFWEIASMRDQIRTFLRANGKFPDFIEVGTDIWQQVYDWHVRFSQPIAFGRTPEGRYTITLLATTVIMRPDVAPNYIGLPYDR